jgi:Leucine-rich repeat (LRR) protein
MAKIIEDFISDYLLKKLVAFTEEKVVMIAGVKNELKKLEVRMRHIGAFLADADRRRITDESVNKWLNELKDVMYDADDMIEIWRHNYQSSPPEEPPSLSYSPISCHLPLLSCFRTILVRHEIAQQVKSLNVRLQEILKNMTDLNIQQLQSEVREIIVVNAARVSSPVIEVDVVGNEIEESAIKLVKMAMMYDKQKFNLIAITGMGGVGKTTLAQRIYNDQTIKNNYVIKMWLSVSQSYSPPQLIKEAIRNAGGNPGQAERESELLPILVEVISGKSFFLVLDDVWKSDVWLNLLENPLKTNTTHGVILITTRDQTIAMQMGVKTEHIHQATILSTKSGWELLCKKAYLTDTIDIKNLTEVGVEIVKRCGGLPLAIKAIAGMLAAKSKSKREWENVLKNNTWSINGLPREMDGALYLSYEDLSADLKQCFLYCSLYPSNRAMHYRDLVEAWIAEGFIKEKEGQIIEDSAEECYYELIRRHLLEPDPSIADHSICRMHDLLKSLGQYLSKGDSFSGDHVLPNVTIISRLRHLYIAETSETICIPGTTKEPLKLRTFMISECLSDIESDIFKRLKNLRVLSINEKGLKSIPDSIGDLIHLRELDLDRSSISNLPESIGSLTNLLFLNLAGCKLLNALPKSLTQLCNLRHLNVQDTPLTIVPKGLGRLQKLTEIRGYQVIGNNDHDEDQDGWDLQELERLSQLRMIEISKLERATNVSAVLANKTHLKKLFLIFSELVASSDHDGELENENSKKILEKLHPPPGVEDVQITNYRGKILPRWLSPSPLVELLPNLKYMQLIGWTNITDLPPLGLLPNLKYLRVLGASSIVKINSDFLGIKGWKGPNLSAAFPKLECLIFKNMPNWEEWVLSDFEGDKSPSWQLMPRIKQLTIMKCPKLRALPIGLQQLTTVKQLVVGEADSIISIQDFSFRCEEFMVCYNRCLESLSNLPGVKEVYIVSNPNLRHVSKLDSLENLYLKDYEIEQLLEWLMKLTEERKGDKDHKLKFHITCNKALFERCLNDATIGPSSSASLCCVRCEQ